MQLFYYETRGKSCRKLLKHEGVPTKIHLFPYEGWAQPALTTYWMLKTYWWSRSRVKLTEVVGTLKNEVKGKVHCTKDGCIVILGKIKGKTNSDFRMFLTSNVSNADFHIGYCITGTLERGDRNKEKGMNLTHFAMIRRRGY